MAMQKRNTSGSLLMKVFLGGGAGLLGVLFSLALFLVETVIHPRRRTLADLYTFTPYELGLPGEAVTFPPLQGDYQVSGWCIPYPGATSTILLSPGYRSRVEDVLRLAAPLWRAGHTIMVFEYYGHGVPTGVPVTLGYREINDYLGAVNYARARAPQTRLGVFACSMGASVAIMAATRAPDVEAFLLDSPFATHRRVLAYNFRRKAHLPFALVAPFADHLFWRLAGYRSRQVEPLREMGHLAPRPVLLIQGGRDTVVDPRDASLLYQAAGAPKELWVVPQADHCCAYFVDRPAYLARVIDFFDLHLKQQQPHD